MINALVVRRNTQLATVQKRSRAAQYVRMSTDNQRYSIQNQAAAIATYAASHNLAIVRTYADEGESGLRINNRSALIELIDDVRSGRADYGHVLVYDVSRWGRFQDIDESAYYEFICKEAGVKIAYCAEQFDNDGSLLSSIVKNLKRVMAAEYSREISVKVHAGACRLASLGFRLGGPPGYALHRDLVSPDKQSKGMLQPGQRKYLQTDHVRLRPIFADEVSVVRSIFHQFVFERKSDIAIANWLNKEGVPNHRDHRWNRRMVHYILMNENYIGATIYNRTSKRLRQKSTNNPIDLWIRCEGAIEPIIDRSVFLAARKIIEERRVQVSEEEMLARLRVVYERRGLLTAKIINGTAGLPSSATYMEHFGTLRNAYKLVGYTTRRNCDWIDYRELWANALSRLSSQIAAAIQKSGERVDVIADDCLLVRSKIGISFRIAQWWAGKKASHSPRWGIQHRKSLLPGWVIAIRLTESNKDALDYLLLPAIVLTKPMIKFTEKARLRHQAQRFATPATLARSIIARLKMSRRPRKAPKSRRSKTTTGRVLR